MAAEELPSVTPAELRRAAISSSIGTTVEWYDFFIYATAAGLVFNKLFFPSFDPLIGTLVAFATYGAGFVARPVGGLVFGIIGDRAGRKKALVTTLLIVGIATFVIGLLPGYATIGIAAPIALLAIRLLHGFGIGGEQGNAILIACEYAPPARRGFVGSWVQIGAPAGFILPLGLFALLTWALPNGAFLSWGWRIPFLLSILLIGVGLYIRLQLAESPLFLALRRRQAAQQRPLRHMLAMHPRAVLLGIGAKLAESTVFTVYAVVIAGYAVSRGIPKPVMTASVLVAIIAEVVVLPLFGALSDRIGRRAIYALGALVSLVLTFPVFYVVYGGARAWIWPLLVPILAIGHAAMYAPQAAFFAELFPTSVRASGIGFVLQIGALIGSVGTLGAGWLLTLGHGGPWALCLYVIGMCVVTLTSLAWLPETAWGHQPVEAGALVAQE